METAIIVAGFGGQGVLLTGRLLAYAGMDEGYDVTWIPSYGPEMRGGTANCTVIISDEPIGAPLVNHPDVALVLNQPSYDKYRLLVKPGGLLVVNRSLIEVGRARRDIEIVQIDANLIAEAFGAKKSVNMAMLGALLGRRPIVSLAAVERALGKQFGAAPGDLLEVNLQVLRQGYHVAQPLPV